jgi:thiamine-phosphate pyrophosphorylase
VTTNLTEIELQKLYRIVDANLNRLKEGIRVVEDINRFFYDRKDLSKELKELRHRATLKSYINFLEFRDSENDVLKGSLKSENERESISDILLSNMKRTQEASRVLEEIFKVIDFQQSENFKSIRYSLYSIEKRLFF